MEPADSLFGGLAMIYGTAVVCALALALAVPVGWAAALALSQYLPARVARPLRMCIELLAAVPSIVYGLIGIIVIRPVIAQMADVPGGDSLAAAGIVLAVMITPTIVAVSVDALSAVPDRYREAAFALGLTRREVIRSSELPLARSGMRAAVLLGLARALGEAIAVFLVVGRADGHLPTSFGEFWDSLVHPGQTLTTRLAGPEPVLAGTSGPYFAALCGLGIVLLALVAAATIWGTRERRRRTTSDKRPVRYRGTPRSSWEERRPSCWGWPDSSFCPPPWAGATPGRRARSSWCRRHTRDRADHVGPGAQPAARTHRKRHAAGADPGPVHPLRHRPLHLARNGHRPAPGPGPRSGGNRPLLFTATVSARPLCRAASWNPRCRRCRPTSSLSPRTRATRRPSARHGEAPWCWS